MTYELEKLFREWEADNLNHGNNHFIDDGIVNESVWAEQKVKICFFLKEKLLNYLYFTLVKHLIQIKVLIIKC